MKYFKVIFIGLLLFFCLTGCQKLEYKETQVTATIIGKRHRAGYFTKAGKVNVYHSSKDYVKLEYNGFEDEISNKDLYKTVAEGDTILVIYGEGTNEEGIVKKRYFKLKE